MRKILKNVLTNRRQRAIINSTNKTTALEREEKQTSQLSERKVIPLDTTEPISSAASHDNGPAVSTRIARIR